MNRMLLNGRRVAFALFVAAVTGCSSGDSATGGGGDAGAQPWLNVEPTWSSIYAGYFGPAGVASCSSGSTCHTSLDQSGGTASNFICPDKDGCYTSLLGTSHLIRATDAMDPAKTPFLAKLRQTTGMGKMPSNSTFVFQSGDLDVLEAWIGKGANND